MTEDFPEMVIFETGFLRTVIFHFFTTDLLAFDVAEIITVPAFIPFTTPLEDTVAIFLFPDFQVTF